MAMVDVSKMKQIEKQRVTIQALPVQHTPYLKMEESAISRSVHTDVQLEICQNKNYTVLKIV